MVRIKCAVWDSAYRLVPYDPSMTPVQFLPGEMSPFAGRAGIVWDHAEASSVIVDNRDVLLKGFYSRTATDLIITMPDGSRYVIEGFYVPQKPPALSDGQATTIPGAIAARFADASAFIPAEGNAEAARIGQVRSLGGRVSRTDADGAVTILKVSDSLYVEDIVVTDAGGNIGLVLIDGTTLALGERGELVLDEFLYERRTHGGRAIISLLSGAAEFVSGSIAKSGKDHMLFKTPVGTIGIRGTRVFVTYNSDTGSITIINRPTEVDVGDLEHAGKIFLSLPDGTQIGPMTSANDSWHWNPQKNQEPIQVQLTENQAHDAVATVENLVNAIMSQPA